MTIETKFNIGDNIWFHTLGCYKRGKVCAITVIVFSDGSSMLEYSIEKSGHSWSRCEQELFPTKEELLKSL